MNPLNWLISQSRRPKGMAGWLLARGMNSAHAPMTDWALSLVSLQDLRTVLDVGCGGGGALLRLSELAPHAELHGIDYSTQALGVAARTNRRPMEQGRVFLREADVSELPYEDSRFDLTVAINSHYLWPDLEAGLGEIMRVLGPRGSVALAGGEYFGGKHDTRNRRLASNGRMNCQTLPELRDIVSEAGYSGAVIHEEWDKGWFCVVGHKPVVDAEESVPPT
jgi:SAM-dependent methyltransferase